MIILCNFLFSINCCHFSSLLVQLRPLVFESPLPAEAADLHFRSQHREWAQSKNTKHTLFYTWSVCTSIPQREKKDQTFLPPEGVSQPSTQGFPFTLPANVEFLLRISQEVRRLRGLGWRVEACARRTMRGERHTLMVESSLADRSSSWSAGLNATEFTTSSWARRARQML